jgi:hypothetical protein
MYDESNVMIGSWTKNGLTVKKGTISGSVITCGGQDNSSGRLIIVDGNDEVIGSWNSTGIHVLKGGINGANITCGGQDNSSGVFKVANASGTTIGTWDKDGINVLSGSIKGTTIVGSTITVGGASTERGLLRIVDDGGELIGSWNYEGIHVMKGSIRGTTITGNTISGGTVSGATITGNTITGGSITGTTITAGGSQSGSIVVKDGEDTVIGRWNKNGISISKGSINIGSGNFVVTTAGAVTAKNATINGSITASVETGIGITDTDLEYTEYDFTNYITLDNNKIVGGVSKLTKKGTGNDVTTGVAGTIEITPLTHDGNGNYRKGIIFSANTIELDITNLSLSTGGHMYAIGNKTINYTSSSGERRKMTFVKGFLVADQAL